ncbi:uncharacterized protein LOC141570024 [Rhinolophus sinicus]|uniref:uncharacterized protein LOC141570024 n=1 Tax=Rhinolophus sinicus TaxID=89399 RepID=UPI003D7A86D2
MRKRVLLLHLRPLAFVRFLRRFTWIQRRFRAFQGRGDPVDQFTIGEGTSASSGSPLRGSETGAPTMPPRTTILSGSSRTEATTSTEGGGTPGTGPRPGTTGPQGGSSAGSGTGTTGVAPGTTVAPGSSNTGATSLPGAGETTGFGVGTGTTTTVPGKPQEPGSYSTEATTSTGGSGPTEAELPGGKLFQFEALVFVYSFIGLLIS